MALIDILLEVNLDIYFNPIFFEVFLGTHANEASEFIGMYFKWRELFITLAFFAFAYACYKLPNFRLNILLATLLFAYSAHYLQTEFRQIYPKEQAKEKKQENIAKLKLYVSGKIMPYRWYETIHDTMIEKQKFLQQYAQLKARIDEQLAKMLQNNQTLPSHKIPNVVLIIGESTQRNYQSLYGYKLPTTPNLDKLSESGNLVAFSDVISPHSHTDPVLQKVLTFSNYERRDWVRQLNILDLMRMAGYKSVWFSNQDPVSVWGNAPELLSKRSDDAYFTSFGRSNERVKLYDGLLLNLFDDYQNGKLSRLNVGVNANKRAQSESKLYIFHLYGTHGGYAHRYPSEYAKFSVDDLKNANLDTFANGEKINNSQLNSKMHYANAVYYNDFVVSEIFKRFENQDAIAFYFSDHADEVFDFRNFAGHTESKGSRYMVEIPFMVYMSDEFKNSHSEIAARIEQIKDISFMSDDFIHLFMDILGVRGSDFNAARSSFSPDYDASRIRYYAKWDYDRDMKNNRYLNANFVPSRIWLHRTNSVEKFERNAHIFQAFEFDTHLLKIADNQKLNSVSAQILKERNKNVKFENPNAKDYYFDIEHDGLKNTIGLSLDEYMRAVAAKQKELSREFRFWLDFKNLNMDNAAVALEILDSVMSENGIRRENLIIESGNFRALGVLKTAGYKTSYYVPYYKKEKLESDRNAIRAHLQGIVDSENTDYLSFAYYLYDFMKGLDLKDKKGDAVKFLTWNEGKSWKDNMGERAFSDPQIRVILGKQ